MNKMNSKYPPAVVTYMSYSGLGIVRTLGRRGISVFALDPNSKQIGMDSRFCKSQVCPPIESDENGHIEFLIQLSKALGQKPVLFPTGDNTVLCYAKYENILKDYYIFTGPNSDTIGRLVTKEALFKTAVKLKIPSPNTFIPKSLSEVKEISLNLAYPCIIKPIRSNSWHREDIQKIVGDCKKVILAHNAEELLASYLKISVCDPDVIISEVIPGDDDELFYFVFYMSDDQKVLGSFAGRKLRVVPIHFGSASFVQSIYDMELEEISVKFLKDLNYRGLGGIEFKRNSRDGKFKLIEFNARYGLWDVLGVRCGVDTAYIAYCDAIGEKVPRKLEYRTGIKWVSISRDTQAFLQYKREGLITLWSWLRSFRGEKQWAVFAWDDLMPSLSLTIRFMFLMLRRATPKILSLYNRLANRQQEQWQDRAENLR